MLRRALDWIVIVAVAAIGLVYGGRASVTEDAVETFTTLVVVGLFVQWVFRNDERFRRRAFWTALLAAGLVMVGLRWLVHR